MKIRVIQVPEIVLISVVFMAVGAAILIAANLIPDKKRDSQQSSDGGGATDRAVHRAATALPG